MPRALHLLFMVHVFSPTVLSLQSLNTTLQSQLNESMKSIELLQNKNEELIKILEGQKEENQSLTTTIHQREQELLEKRQQYDIDSTKLKLGVCQLQFCLFLSRVFICFFIFFLPALCKRSLKVYILLIHIFRGR